MIVYKAAKAGLYVVKVDPHYTSQTCSHCGQIGDRQKHTFQCSHCGFHEHSDLNASFNILKAGLKALQSGLV